MSLPSGTRRALALAGVAISILLLIPGLSFPVLSIRGQLNQNGLEDLTHQLLEKGINDTTVEAIRPLLNPGLLPAFEASPNGLKGMLLNSIESQLVSQLKAGGSIEIYSQTRSIVGSVRHLYSVGSYTAATLILLFSVIVPFAKSGLVSWAVLQSNPVWRRRALHLVEMIAKWSMADVFAVAIIIAFLAAQASQSIGSSTAAVVFDSQFGAGFYWFAGYCVLSIAVQQATARWIMRP